MFILDNMDKEKLYDILVDHIKKEWTTRVEKDVDYENRINNQSNNEIDYKKILEYDQLRHKGRIDELNDLIEFIERIEQTLI